ncbi:BTAD domain-containing putative transcriptional regulator [Streptomyces sp. NPDC058751]|uniref:AfsR/SARP family transcriptional regulator n=1 Tax=Streptomyces sp. NPDC058751 TaxID=3346623 RepID=UPI0036C2A816
MRFHLLGPLEVLRPTTADCYVTPRAAKHRIVLATLLVRAGEPVPTETLINELWGETPPRTATTTIQVYISQLRKLLGLADSDEAQQAIVTRRPGYLIRLDPGRLDLTRFEVLYQQGVAAAEQREHAKASELQDRALALWRGRFLADTPAGPLLSAEAARLSELRMASLEQRIRADLHLGRHHELLGELRAATTEHPLREELHAHLMVALYRSGRQAEALQTFSALRRTLVDELAIEPGPALQQLHQRLLSGDPRLLHTAEHVVRSLGSGPQPPPPSGKLPPPDVRFTAREAELDHLVGLLREDSAMVVVTGAPGTGKSALALQAAQMLADDFPDGRILIDLRTAQSTERVEITERLLRALGAPAPLPDQPAARRALLNRLVEGRRLLVVLDNADRAQDLGDVLPGPPGTATLITVRYLPGRLRPTTTLRLRPPEQTEAEKIFTVAGGPAAAQAAPETVQEIVALCDRLPYALSVAGARLTAHPHWTAKALANRLRAEKTRLDELCNDGLDVRARLLDAYEECSAPERDAFRLLSVLPPGPFTGDAAAAVLGIAPVAAEALLDRLVRHGLLAVEGADHCGYEIPLLHRLLAVELAEQDTTKARHAAIGRLCTAYADAAEWSGVLVVADDRALARPTGPVLSSHAMGPRPPHWFAEQQTALVWTVRAAADAGQWCPVLRLAGAVGDFLEATAAWDDWATTQEAALRAAEATGDGAGRARALRSLGDLAWQQRRFDDAYDHFEKARRTARQAGSDAEAARSLAGLVDLHLEHGSLQEAARLAAEAQQAADAAPDPRARFEVLRCRALLALVASRGAEAEELFGRCLETAGELADRRLEAWARRAGRSVAPRSGDAPGAYGGVETRPGVWRLRPGRTEPIGDAAQSRSVILP